MGAYDHRKYNPPTRRAPSGPEIQDLVHGKTSRKRVNLEDLDFSSIEERVLTHYLGPSNAP